MSKPQITVTKDDVCPYCGEDFEGYPFDKYCEIVRSKQGPAHSECVQASEQINENDL